MGNVDCCSERNLDIIEYDTQIEEKNPEKVIASYMEIIEKINKKIISKKEQNVNKSYLINLSNIPELIEIINKNIELINNNKYDSIILTNEEIKQNLKLKIDNILIEIDQKIKIITNEIETLSELEPKENDEAIYYLNLCEPYKKEAINYINNINEKDLENYINKKNPSKKDFLILRFLFLIINPEDKAKIPGIIIIKDLEIMQNECFKKSPYIIKKIIKERLEELSLINSEILEENKFITEYPYNDLNEMENISSFHKNFFGFLQNYINLKKSYDIYEHFLKKYEETKKNKESLIKKKKRLEQIKQQIIILI